MSNRFRMIVASSFRSKAKRSMYACDSGTKSRTFWGRILSASFFFFLEVECEKSLFQKYLDEYLREKIKKTKIKRKTKAPSCWNKSLKKLNVN